MDDITLNESPVVLRTYESLCIVCRKRVASVRWGTILDFTHGFVNENNRCGQCAAREQLRHALGRAIRIPILIWKSVMG